MQTAGCPRLYAHLRMAWCWAFMSALSSSAPARTSAALRRVLRAALPERAGARDGAAASGASGAVTRGCTCTAGWWLAAPAAVDNSGSAAGGTGPAAGARGNTRVGARGEAGGGMAGIEAAAVVGAGAKGVLRGTGLWALLVVVTPAWHIEAGGMTLWPQLPRSCPAAVHLCQPSALLVGQPCNVLQTSPAVAWGVTMIVGGDGGGSTAGVRAVAGATAEGVTAIGTGAAAAGGDVSARASAGLGVSGSGCRLQVWAGDRVSATLLVAVPGRGRLARA